MPWSEGPSRLSPCFAEWQVRQLLLNAASPELAPSAAVATAMDARRMAAATIPIPHKNRLLCLTMTQTSSTPSPGLQGNAQGRAEVPASLGQVHVLDHGLR